MMQFDIATILLEILNFVLLSIGLYHFLFRPVIKRVETRAAEKLRIEQEIRENLQSAQNLREEQESRLNEVNDVIHKLMDEARAQIENERSQMQAAIHAEIEQSKKSARADIQSFQKRELEEFNELILNTLMSICGELIEKISPPALHDALVQEANDYVWKMGREQASEIDALRRSLGSRTPTIRFISTRTLSMDQQRMLARSFSALTDRHAINFEFDTNIELYGGLQVRVGDILIDNSIAAQLNKIRTEVKKELLARIGDA